MASARRPTTGLGDDLTQVLLGLSLTTSTTSSSHQYCLEVSRFDPPPPEDLICPICHGVLVKPQQTPCEHMFCERCVVSWLSSDEATSRRATAEKPCPVCRLPISALQLVAPPRALRNILGQLRARCRFVSEGCDAKVTLDNLIAHEDVCVHGPACCPHRLCPLAAHAQQQQQQQNQQAGPSFLTRARLQAHIDVCGWAEVMCPNHCGLLLTRNNVEAHMANTCTRQRVSCPNCGLSDIPKEELPRHIAHVCARALISCTVVDGCTFVAERGDHTAWSNHAKDAGAATHLRLALEECESLRRRLATLEQNHASTQIATTSSTAWASVSWVLSDVTPTRVGTGFRTRSPEFCFHDAPLASLRYYFALVVDVNNADSKNHVGVYFVPRPSPTARWPLNHHIEISVMDHSTRALHKLWVCSHGEAFSEFVERHNPPTANCWEGWGFSQLLRTSDLVEGGFLHNQSLTVRVRLLPQTLR